MNVIVLIFDFDGTVVDTETPTFDVWRDIFSQHGTELTLTLWEASLGTHGGLDPARYLAESSANGVDPMSLRSQARKLIRRRLGREPLLPGVSDLLKEAKRSGVPTAVASSSSRAWVAHWLDHHGIRSLFGPLCCRGDAQRLKPAPDLFLLAAERLKAHPRDCLVIEDSPNGIRAARAAGMTCVAIPNALTRRLKLPPAELVLESLADVSLAHLAAEVAVRRRSG